MWKKVQKSILAKEAGLLSKRTALLSKKIMLTVCAGACFFAVQNPVMAEEITIASNDDLGKLDYTKYGYDDNYYSKNPGDTIVITGGKFNYRFNGSWSVNEAAKAGSIRLEGGEVQQVYGGWSHDAEVTNNTVTVSGGTIQGYLYGGYSMGSGKEVAGNTVTIKGGTINRTIYAGRNDSVDDNGNDNGNVTKNTVTISGGMIGGSVYGGSSNWGVANNNEVTISDGTIKGSNLCIVCGGDSGRYAEATNNTVTISGGTINCNFLYGGCSTYKVANNNKVTISGGEIKGVVYGGDSYSGAATNNIVNISGGTINNAVYGGDSYSGAATNNTVNLSGGVIAGTVYGGYSVMNGKVSGNTLNVKGLDIKAGNISAFDNINFYIPSSATNGSTMLNLTADGNTNISAATVKAGVAIEGDSTLQVGDTVNLIKKDSGTLITTKSDGTEMTYGKLTATEGVSVDYELDVKKSDDKTLVATINAIPVAPDPGDGGEQGGSGQGGSSDAKPGLKPQTKSLVETQAAGMAMLSSGMDMLAGEGITNAIAAAADNGSADYCMFGMLGASNMKYKTGSHVDMDGWNLGLGFAKTVENNAGKLTFGPVISYGKGSYDSYLDDGIHGEGDSDYFGVALFAHQANNDGLYYEGSVSGGRVSNDYSSNDLVGAGGAKVHEEYDTDGTFVAAHLGIGKVMDVSDKAKLDIYGKYFYAHQGGDDAKLTTGETYHFDSVDSNRIRVGARYAMDAGKAAENGKALSSVYVGTAYEYEFSGDARATYKGMETASPSLKGSSGMLELGWKGTPSASSPLTIDLSANGWCGQKQGVGLKANLLWSF